MAKHDIHEELSKEQLKTLSTDDIYEYFSIHARFNDQIHRSSGGGYQIRVGTKILHDAETDKLLEKVKEYVGWKENSLPKDRSEISYEREDGHVVSYIRQSCGCEWKMIWVKSGRLVKKDAIESITLCEDHDPTIDDEGECIDFK